MYSLKGKPVLYLKVPPTRIRKELCNRNFTFSNHLTFLFATQPLALSDPTKLTVTILNMIHTKLSNKLVLALSLLRAKMSFSQIAELLEFQKFIYKSRVDLLAVGVPNEFINLLLSKSSLLAAMPLPKGQSTSDHIWEQERDFQDTLEQLMRSYSVSENAISHLRTFSEAMLLKLISLATLADIRPNVANLVLRNSLVDIK